MTTLSNVYCIWYPSGGFGHYINAILSLHGKNFCRPNNKIIFSEVGDSHSLRMVAPKYFHDQDYEFEFDADKYYSVLIDNGINNEEEKFKNTFPGAQIIKTGYNDQSWPIVARTMIVKAQKKILEADLDLDDQQWSEKAAWAQREKYFLYLRDHNLRHKWKNNVQDYFLDVLEILDYDNLKQKIESFGIELNDFSVLHKEFVQHNLVFFQPVITARDILTNLNHNKIFPTYDTWTQAVVYFFIWLQYGIEVPHNDYSNWFTTPQDIVKMLESHGVNIDSN